MTILPETGAEGALAVAEKLRALLGEPYPLDGALARIGVSIGVAAFPHPEVRGGEDLLSAAAEAMKAARRAGTGHVGRFDG